jgi:hypothetical protein
MWVRVPLPALGDMMSTTEGRLIALDIIPSKGMVFTKKMGLAEQLLACADYITNDELFEKVIQQIDFYIFLAFRTKEITPENAMTTDSKMTTYAMIAWEFETETRAMPKVIQSINEHCPPNYRFGIREEGSDDYGFWVTIPKTFSF